jgi:hypothetical protein
LRIHCHILGLRRRCLCPIYRRWGLHFVEVRGSPAPSSRLSADGAVLTPSRHCRSHFSIAHGPLSFVVVRIEELSSVELTSLRAVSSGPGGQGAHTMRRRDSAERPSQYPAMLSQQASHCTYQACRPCCSGVSVARAMLWRGGP